MKATTMRHAMAPSRWVATGLIALSLGACQTRVRPGRARTGYAAMRPILSARSMSKPGVARSCVGSSKA